MRRIALAASLGLSAIAGLGGCHRASAPPRSDAGPGAVAEDRRDTTLLGGERGLDHVGIAVRDLDEATKTYVDVLGFSRPQPGKLPNGIRNVNYYFGDATYLETLTYWDREKAGWLAAFTEKHSGGVFAVLSAYSADATRSYLSARGITLGAVYPGTIETADEDAMPDEKWKTFFLPTGFLPGDPLYFISYSRAGREDYLAKLAEPQNRRKLSHRNTALGVRAVWIAVANLGAATSMYESIGLARGRAFVDEALGVDGQIVAAGRGEIWLIAPRRGDGGAASFLAERGGPGIIGVTLQAGSVTRAAEVIGERTGRSFSTYQGVRGTSIRVPPELTEGVWLELSER